jgi:hypothetical protein
MIGRTLDSSPSEASRYEQAAPLIRFLHEGSTVTHGLCLLYVASAIRWSWPFAAMAAQARQIRLGPAWSYLPGTAAASGVQC